MLTNKKIKNLFSKMVLFSGKLAYNPNTLNNRVLSYLLSHEWQEYHIGKKLAFQKHSMIPIPIHPQKFDYKHWMSLIKSVSLFNIIFKKAMKVPPKCPGMALFYDWSVYGDMMLLPEYKAVALVDDEKENPITTTTPFPITKKMGQDKGVMSIVDLDAEAAYKIFSMPLKLNSDKKIRFEPACSRNLSMRITKYSQSEGDSMYLAAPASQQTDWFFNGQISDLRVKDPDEGKVPPQFWQRQFMDSLIRNTYENRIFLKQLQYRYNHNTKVSQVRGFFSQSVNDSNDLNMQGWRTIGLMSKPGENQPSTPDGVWSGFMHYKITKYGIILDLAATIPEANDAGFNPVYPESITYSLKDQAGTKVYNTFTLTREQIQNIMDKSGGFYFLKSPIPAQIQGLPWSAELKIPNGDQNQCFAGSEKKSMLNVKDACVKSDYDKDVPLSQALNKNQAEVEVYCSQLGKPFTGDADLKITCNSPSNYGYIEQYYSPNFQKDLEGFVTEINQSGNEELRAELNVLLKQDPRSTITRDKIVKEIYQGDAKLSIINEVCRKFIEEKTISKTRDRKPSDCRYITSYTWKNLQTNKPFQMMFYDEATSSKTLTKTVSFVDGKAKIKVCLDNALTAANNPRSPEMSSLAVQGNLQFSTGSQSNETFFFVLFFETDPKIDNVVDWYNDISPILKKMGLLYPSMQKLVDLYTFRGMSMLSMKRAFDVEDENHPRYMPATRQLSAMEHRKIRKWLYDPHFKVSEGVRLLKNNQFNKKINKRAVPTVETFNADKEDLIADLKTAFTLELSTIPLYLTAMFTAPEKHTENLIRSVAIDEMKHLFIVSNLLNAVGKPNAATMEEMIKAVPYLDKNYIPSYKSGTLTGILKCCDPITPEDEKYKKLLQSFYILPCVPDQLLKFISIELPGEVDGLHFIYTGANPEIEKRVENLNNLLDFLGEQKKNCPDFKTIGDLYAGIMERFWNLSDSQKIINERPDGEKVTLFSGDPSKQFSYFNLPDMEGIYDLRGALNQMRLIIEEGEGANLFTLEGDINKDSHFFKFIETYVRGEIYIDETHPQNTYHSHPTIRDSSKFAAINEEQEAKLGLMADHWLNDCRKRQINQEVNKEFREESATDAFPKTEADRQYPDIYSVFGFINAYEKILEEFNYLFNTSFDNYKSQYKKGSNEKDLEMQAEFQVWRRKRMENAIGRMRQMTLHADRVIYPSVAKDPVVGVARNLGTQPNYEMKKNMDDEVSFTCPEDKK